MSDSDTNPGPTVEPTTAAPEGRGGNGGGGLGLLGIEIGANKIRLALLDPEATRVVDAIERSIFGMDNGGDRQAVEARLQTALSTALDDIGLAEPTPLLLGVTIGRPNCGVGSGPALRDWLEDLSARVGQQFLYIGDHGVSYAPADAVGFLRRIFKPLPVHLDRIELAPVAACRVVPPMHPGAVTLGSGVAWSARMLGQEVLEAFEIAGGPLDEVLSVVSNQSGMPIEKIEGVEVEEELCQRRGLQAPALAPAIGVAVALRTTPSTNLLDAKLVGQPPSTVAPPAALPQGGPASDPAAGYRSDDPYGVPRQPERGQWDDYRGWTSDELRRRAGGPGFDDPVPAGRASPGGRGGGPGSLPVTAPGQARADRYDTRNYGQPPDWEDDRLAVRYDDRYDRSAAGTATAGGFHVSDFFLGALLMLALVLTAALVLL